MKSTAFDWDTGVVTYWDMDELELNRTLAEQSQLLKEDLAQIEFPNGRILDIGWFPSFDADGEFAVSIVQDGDWSNPLARLRGRSWQELTTAISASIRLATGA